MAVLVVAVSATAAPGLANPAGASAGNDAKDGARATATKLARFGHVTFWDCPAKTTTLLVVVNALTLHSGATLQLNFTVRNGAKTACTYTAPFADATPGAKPPTLQAGPCGSIRFEIVGPGRRNVWPGPQIVNCPALGFAQLAPAATVSGMGSWNQTEPNSTKRVPVGRYTLVVENEQFSFPLHVVGS